MDKKGIVSIGNKENQEWSDSFRARPLEDHLCFLNMLDLPETEYISFGDVVGLIKKASEEEEQKKEVAKKVAKQALERLMREGPVSLPYGAGHTEALRKAKNKRLAYLYGNTSFSDIEVPVRNHSIAKLTELAEKFYGTSKIGWIIGDTGIYSTGIFDSPNCYPTIEAAVAAKNISLAIPNNSDFFSCMNEVARVYRHGKVSVYTHYCWYVKKRGSVAFNYNLTHNPMVTLETIIDVNYKKYISNKDKKEKFIALKDVGSSIFVDMNSLLCVPSPQKDRAPEIQQLVDLAENYYGTDAKIGWAMDPLGIYPVALCNSNKIEEYYDTIEELIKAKSTRMMLSGKVDLLSCMCELAVKYYMDKKTKHKQYCWNVLMDGAVRFEHDSHHTYAPGLNEVINIEHKKHIHPSAHKNHVIAGVMYDTPTQDLEKRRDELWVFDNDARDQLWDSSIKEERDPYVTMLIELAEKYYGKDALIGWKVGNKGIYSTKMDYPGLSGPYYNTIEDAVKAWDGKLTVMGESEFFSCMCELSRNHYANNNTILPSHYWYVSATGSVCLTPTVDEVENEIGVKEEIEIAYEKYVIK